MTDDIVRPPCSFEGSSPRLIRDRLTDEERPAFERQFRDAMAAAAQTLDLTEVETLLQAWRRIAELTEREGAERRRRVLQRASAVWRSRDNADRAPGQDVVDVLAGLMSEDQRRQTDENRASFGGSSTPGSG